MVKAKTLRKIKAKKGIDPVLEQKADAILRIDRKKQKAVAKRKRYLQNTRERKAALASPSETIVKIRDERLLKQMANESKPKFRPLTPNSKSMVSRNTQAAITARGKAREAGRAASVDIAKARLLASKKASRTLQMGSSAVATPAVRRRAESGLASIVKGKAYKRVARLGGALGIVGMFADHLGRKKGKNA